jgi:8-oxo-dGTP pyrophosphatase MutT (NUDIX family)
MNFQNKENKCHKIGEDDIWHSRSVAVVGMVLMLHEGEIYVLIGKRGKGLPNAVGQWCMPCGYLDWNETCEEAVVREVWEETGLNLYKAMENYEIVYNHMHFPWRINSLPDSPLQNVSLHYAVLLKTEPLVDEFGSLPDVTTANNVDPLEVEETRWVKVNEIHNYDCAFQHDNIIRVFVNSIPQ